MKKKMVTRAPPTSTTDFNKHGSASDQDEGSSLEFVLSDNLFTHRFSDQLQNG